MHVCSEAIKSDLFFAVIWHYLGGISFLRSARKRIAHMASPLKKNKSKKIESQTTTKKKRKK